MSNDEHTDDATLNPSLMKVKRGGYIRPEYSEEAEPARAGGAVSKQFMELRNAIDQMEKVIADHKELIDPILNPDWENGAGKSNGDDNEDVRKTSDIACQMEMLAARIRSATYRLQAVSNRVDL